MSATKMCFKYVALELQVSRKFKNMKIDIHIYNYFVIYFELQVKFELIQSNNKRTCLVKECMDVVSIRLSKYTNSFENLKISFHDEYYKTINNESIINLET